MGSLTKGDNMKVKLAKIEKKQKTYYNSIAKEYDQHYHSPYALKYRHYVYNKLLQGIDIAGKKVLDAMCGGGEGTAYLLTRGADVTGLDISDECCKLYRHHFPENKVVCSSILNTEFPDAYFDVILTDSLHHLPPFMEQGIDEIYRILKPGGYFCCWEPVANSIFSKIRTLWYKMDRRYFQDNEESIDFKKLIKNEKERFEVLNVFYGGNIAYLLVNCSMVFRIPTKYVKFYAPALIRAEFFFNLFQPAILSLWGMCLMRKRI